MYVVRCMTHVYCMTRQFDPSLFVLVMEILETIVFMCESAHTNIRVGGKCRLALEYYCVPTRTWILLCAHSHLNIIVYPLSADSHLNIIVPMTHLCCVPHDSCISYSIRLILQYYCVPWLIYVACHDSCVLCATCLVLEYYCVPMTHVCCVSHNSCIRYDTMGWLRLVGSLKLWISFAEYSLFYRALLQKRPIILRSLLIVATPYSLTSRSSFW